MSQSEVLAFLSSPDAHGGHAVERIDTHASVVFLAGDRAWKLKRAVQYDYLDFSTVARRQATCEAELRLNRRTAPNVYVRVAPVTREADGSLAIGGRGDAIDWLIEMVRFDQSALLDRRASEQTLDLATMTALASVVAQFHAGAERRPDHGGAASMEWVIAGNAAGWDEHGAGVLAPDACAMVTREARAVLARHAAHLDRRRAAGFVRQCHGDLHLRNIVMLEGRPTLFDGVEFNDELACIDVMYDLAFLLMDLWRRALPRHANAVWNGYLDETADLDGVALMSLFLSCRAAIRAKTSATAARLQTDAPRRREGEALAREYLAMADQLLRPAAPCLIGVGGLSGSGKSTLARALAPLVGAVPGAVVLQSDAIRKRLCGVAPFAPLGPAGYTAEVSQRVYHTASERARRIVEAGHAVVVDAVFNRRTDREALEAAARDAGVPFVGLWLEASDSALVERVRQRRADVSDATIDVIGRQREAQREPVSWHQLDASGTASEVLQSAQAHLVRGT